jgi:hypothetical protein
MLTRLVVFFAIVATVVFGASFDAKAQEHEYKIFFISYSNESQKQIYSINPDGSDVFQITNELNGVDSNTFDVSSDGSLVAYTTGGQLVMVNANGENRRVLFDSADYLSDGYNIVRTETPQFSEDAAQIAFFWDFPDQRVGVINVASGAYSEVAVYPNEQLPAHPEFSPDGSKLALTRGCERDTNISSLLSLDVIDLESLQVENVEDCSSEYRPMWQSNDRVSTVYNPFNPPIPVSIEWLDGSLVLYSENEVIYGSGNNENWIMVVRVEVRPIVQ